MEATEFRIGNYYNWYAEGKNYPMQVEAKDFANDDYKNFQPIELTEKLLLKCGFRNQNHGWNIGDFGLFNEAHLHGGKEIYLIYILL